MPVALDPKLRARIDYEAAAFPDVTRLPVSEGRDVVRAMARETDRLAGPPPALARVEDHSFSRLSDRVYVRLYFPHGAPSPSPVLVYLHGGGWVFGDLETHDSICREIAARSGVVVASLDYHRSPEEKFPIAIEDGYAALRWLSAPDTVHRFDLRSDQIAVGGDSAGGNMAAVLAVLTHQRREFPLSGQMLICPVMAYFPETASYSDYGSGYGLEAAFMPWMWDQYLGSPRQGQDPRVAPLRTPEVSGLAPALVITAECDLLRDEGELYADRLRAAGVPTTATRYEGMVHGFLDYRGIVSPGWTAIDEIATTLRRWFKK